MAKQRQQGPPRCDGVLYTIQPGDTFFLIARRFGVTLQELIAANPQIPDPARIFPGQVICVPINEVVALPCCAVLNPVNGLPPLARGSVLIQSAPGGRFALAFSAVGLPDPATLGNFNSYVGSINIVGLNVVFSAVLGTTQFADQPLTWSGSRIIIDDPTSPDNILTVRPFNIGTDTVGSIVLTNTVGACC